jgi:hypothetical protein
VVASVHEPEDFGTPDSWQAAVLIYQSMDIKTNPGVTNSVELKIILTPPNPNASEVIAVGYSINNDNQGLGNPYALWKSYGSPKFPTISQFKSMRAAEGPSKTFNTTIRDFNNPTKFMINMETPEVTLIHFCARADSQPDQVNNVDRSLRVRVHLQPPQYHYHFEQCLASDYQLGLFLLVYLPVSLEDSLRNGLVS